jgi:hypothetical protein
VSPPPQHGGPSAQFPPGYVAPPRNGMGTAALAVGVAALVLSIIFFPVALVLAVVGSGLGFAARNRARRGEATNTGMATSGLLLSLLALLITVSYAFLFANAFNKTKDCTDQPKSQQKACIKDKLQNR